MHVYLYDYSLLLFESKFSRRWIWLWSVSFRRYQVNWYSLVTLCRPPPVQLRLLVDAETKDFGLVALRLERGSGGGDATRADGLAAHLALARGLALARDHLRVRHEEHVGERRAEVGAVNGAVPVRLGRVDVLAPRAVQFDGLLVGDVRQSDREQVLSIAVDARAAPEVALPVLVELGLARRRVSCS